MIQVQDYHKAYRETIAVDGLSFVVPEGAILGLVGPNGAGKTTTLRALAGIIRPTRGRLFIAGHDVVNDPIAAKRVLAYIPDDPKLFDALTVREHLEFIAATYRVADWASKSEALLQQFELVEKRDTMAQELSRGMRQKVAICCAYLHDPKAILFDEPLTGLDPYAIRTLKASIARASRAAAPRSWSARTCSPWWRTSAPTCSSSTRAGRSSPGPSAKPGRIMRTCKAKPRSKRSSSGRPNRHGHRESSRTGPHSKERSSFPASLIGIPCIPLSSNCSCSRTRPRSAGAFRGVKIGPRRAVALFHDGVHRVDDRAADFRRDRHERTASGLADRRQDWNRSPPCRCWFSPC